MTMQDINTMFVRVLIKRGRTTWLDSEIAHVEVWRVFVGSNENLTGGTVGIAIFGSVSTYRDIMPAQFAIFHIVLAMNCTHFFSNRYPTWIHYSMLFHFFILRVEHALRADESAVST